MNPAANAPGRLWLKVWGVIIGVYLLGCVTGASLDAIYRTRPGSNVQTNSTRAGDAYFETLRRELALDAAQASEMRAILEQTRSEYKTVCAEVRPRYDLVRDAARSRMRALLSAEQQQQFDLIVTQEDCNCPERREK